jgi:hypothetical protein
MSSVRARSPALVELQAISLVKRYREAVPERSFLGPDFGYIPKITDRKGAPHGKATLLSSASSGNARVTIHGKDFYLGPYGSKESKQRYNALMAEWLASDESQSFGVAPQQLTMAQLMVDYLSYCKKHYGSKTSEYCNILQAMRAVSKLYRDIKAKDFGTIQFKAVRQMLVDSECTRRKPKKRTRTKRTRTKDKASVEKQPARPMLSRGYINGLMKRVCRMFRWAAAEGMLPATVYDTLRLIPSLQIGRTKAREAAPVKPVDESLVLATIPHCSPVVRKKCDRLSLNRHGS